MTLWDIIRDFFVKYIFGGFDSSGTGFGPSVGLLWYPEAGGVGDRWTGSTIDGFVNSGLLLESGENIPLYTSFGDYLSTTATIIVLVLLCFLLVKLAIWIFKLGANLIRLR